MEHRVGHRLTIHEKVLFRLGSAAPIAAVLTDISVSGAFVQTPTRLSESMAAQIRWPASDASTPKSARAVAAWVVRRSPTGYGIEWADFAPRSVCLRLNRYWLREALAGLAEPDTTRAGDQPLATNGNLHLNR
jgi:hypothetical protein